jgi:hypothetical protein
MILRDPSTHINISIQKSYLDIIVAPAESGVSLALPWSLNQHYSYIED